MKLLMFNAKEITSFTILQFLLFKFNYFTHFNPEQCLYIDLDILKQFSFGAMIYYIKNNNFDNKSAYLAKSKIKPILFLSWLFKDAETRY